MQILYLTVKLYAPWVHSLKEKRMIVNSLTSKLRHKFNVSVAEVADQDVHQTIMIGIAALAAHQAQADKIMENLVSFVDRETEAEIQAIKHELR